MLGITAELRVYEPGQIEQ